MEMEEDPWAWSSLGLMDWLVAADPRTEEDAGEEGSYSLASSVDERNQEAARRGAGVFDASGRER